MSKKMAEVDLANPYQYNWASRYDADMMLIRQENFPLEFNKVVDKIEGVWSDRLWQWDREKMVQLSDKYIKPVGSFDQWMKTAPAENILGYIAEAINNTEVEWTGFRITVTSNRMNGYPAYLYNVFANLSGVQVYSDAYAPNVRLPQITFDGEGGFYYHEPYYG